MPVDLSDTLVVGISATALFDLSEADQFFRQRYREDRDTAVLEYRKYMLQREKDPLEDGAGMPLVRALLQLNEFQLEGESALT